MATNYWEAGHRIRVSPPADVVSGVPIQLGSKAAVPITDGVSGGDLVAFALSGVWAWTQADPSMTLGTVVDFDTGTGDIVAGGAGTFELGTFYEYAEGKICVLVNDAAYPHYQP